MAGRIYNFENPDRFVAGAIGQAGSRTFYLQARDAGRLVSILVEKVQVALLAERLAELLAEVRQRGAGGEQRQRGRRRGGRIARRRRQSADGGVVALTGRERDRQCAP